MTYTKAQLQEMAKQAAIKHGIDPHIFQRQINQESGWNIKAKSPVGAMGLGQLMPSTAKNLGVKDPYDPVQNLDAAARYMAQNIKNYGSYEMALAAYNGGPGAVAYFKKHGGIFHDPSKPANSWANQTGGYVKKIMGGTPGKKDDARQAQPNWLDALLGGVAQAEPMPEQAPGTLPGMPAPTQDLSSRSDAELLQSVNSRPSDLSSMSDADLLKSVNQDNAATPEITPIGTPNTAQMSDDELLASVNQPQQDTGNPLTRTGQLLGGAATTAVQGLGQMAQQAWGHYASGSLTDDLINMSPMLDPTKNVGQNLQAKGDALAALITGGVKGTRDLIQGVTALPADIANAGQFIATGNMGNWKPAINLPDLNELGTQTLAKNPTAGVAGQMAPMLFPMTQAGRVAKGLEAVAQGVSNPVLKGAVKMVAKPGVVGTALEGATGVAYDPRSDLTAQQRIESRISQGEMTAAGAGLGYAGSGLLKTVAKADKIQKVMDATRLSKDAAENIVKSGNAEKVIELTNQARAIPEKGLLPEVTRGFKKLDVIGDRQAAFDHLTGTVGLEPTKAQQLLQEAETLQGTRKSVPHYTQVQRIDEQINQLLRRDAAPEPTKKAQIQLLGGKKAVAALREAPIVQRSKELAQHIGATPEAAKAILDGVRFPQEILGQNDYLTLPQAIASRAKFLLDGGFLSEGRLANTTRTASSIWQQVREHVPALQDATQTAMSQLNNIRDEMTRTMLGMPSMSGKLLRPVRDLAMDAGSWFDKVIKDNSLARVMSGDTAGMDAKLVAKLQPIADQLAEFDRTHIIPRLAKFSGLPESHFTPGKISNSQLGSQFYTMDLHELAKQMSPADFNAFVQKYNSSADPTNPKIIVGYGDDLKTDVWKHLQDAKADYSREFPFLYDAKGNVKTNLVVAQPNAMRVMADLRFYNKLDQGQMLKLFGRKSDFINDFLQRTNLTKKELSAAYDDAVIKGNVRSTTWSKFVGSLQGSDNKLLLKNNDPFRGYWRQTVDLAKKEHLEPVINEIEAAQEALKQRQIDDFTQGTKNPVEAIKQGALKRRLQDEIDWYEDLKGLYKRTPSQLDAMAADAAETAFSGMLKSQALKVARRYGDTFAGVQSLAKLALNMPAAISNLAEAITAGIPNLGTREYAALFHELQTKNPVKIMADIVKETHNNPQLKPLLYHHDAGTGLSSGFTTSQKFMGSRVLGGFRDVVMYPFSQGTTGGKLLSYKIFKTIGEQQGFKGKSLDDFIVTQMTRNKALPELDRIPAQTKTQLGKVMLLLQSYLVRTTDLAAQHYKTVLDLPSPDNIRKAMMFDLTPALVFGGQASVSGSLIAKVIDTGNIMSDTVTGDHHEPFWDEQRARNSLIAKGLGGSLGTDTSFFSRDPSQLANIAGGLALNTVKDVANFLDTVKKANATGTQEEIPGAANNFLKSEILPYKRVSQAADIINTGSYTNTRGEPIIKAKEGAGKYLDAANAAMGFKNNDVVQVQASTRMLKSAERVREDEVRYLNDALRRAMQTNNTQYQDKLIDRIIDRTLSVPDVASAAKWAATLDLPADQRFLESLNQKAQILVRENPKLKPLIDIIDKRAAKGAQQ